MNAKGLGRNKKLNTMRKSKAHAKLERNLASYPDAKKHQLVSFIKSGIRIAGYLTIPFNIAAAVSLLVVSEAVGIIEELV